MHRLDLGLYSHPKEFLFVCLLLLLFFLGGMGGGGGGGGVRTRINSEEKIPCTGKILLRGGPSPRRCNKQDSEPNTLPTSYSGS